MLPRPVATMGGHAGVIIRQFDKKLGVRINVEPAALILLDSVDLVTTGGEILFTVAFVY